MTDLSDGFLEEQIASLNKMKEMLEEELKEEYRINRDLRRESKDFWDLAMEEREKAAKVNFENQQMKQKLARLETVAHCMQEVSTQLAASRLATTRDARMVDEQEVVRGKRRV